MSQYKNHTYWEAVCGALPAPRAALAQDARADVVVVGAGIVGLTAAYELAKAGKKVVVLEALQCATQVTARSTAKVTSQHGLIYGRLIRDFGEHNARLYAQANQAAVEYIGNLIEKEHLECAFERIPAYIYTPDIETASAVDDEAVAAAMLGLPARVVTTIPAPVECSKALCFEDQAQFNPVLYLSGLACTVSRMAQLYEFTRVTGVEQDGGVQHVSTEAGHTVTAKHVIVATHLPVVPEGKFFAKAFTYSHIVTAAPLNANQSLRGMFLTAGDITYSYRVDTSGATPHLITVGPEYRTGDPEDQARSLDKLLTFLHDKFGIETPAYQWTNEDFRSMDGMPFVGPASSGTPRLYVATGFDAWGITNGVAAARLITDLVLQKENPCIDFYDATRIKPLAGGTEFVKENLKSAKQFVVDHLKPDTDDAQEHIGMGQARIVREDGENIARYRDMDGRLYEVSATCTHMGCNVDWNNIDHTWDCPCHGSRFSPDGTVLHGPATSPLKPVGEETD